MAANGFRDITAEVKKHIVMEFTGPIEKRHKCRIVCSVVAPNLLNAFDMRGTVTLMH